MENNTAYSGQSFFDKVIELTGDVENAFAMALLNSRSFTDALIIGERLIAVPATRKPIVALFNEKNRPATELDEIEIIEPIIVEAFGFPYEFPLAF